MASRNKFTNVKKLYEYLQKSNIVNISEDLAELKFRDFYNVWNQTPVKVKNILIHAYNHNISNLHQIITINRPDAPSSLFDSSDSYSLGLVISRGKTPKVQLGLYALKMPTSKFMSTPQPKDPFIRRHNPVNPKSISLDPTYTHQGKEILLSDLGKDDATKGPAKVGDTVNKLSARLLDLILFMKNKSAQIDSGFYDSGDTMVLGYATYISDKSPGGFKGYSITGEKVQNTVSEKGKSVLNHIELVKAMDDVLQAETGHSHITPELVRAFRNYVDALEELVSIRYPKGHKVPINLAEGRDFVRLKRYEETGSPYVKGLGFTQGERDTFSEITPFHEILGIGMEYLDSFNKLFQAAKELRAAIDSNFSKGEYRMRSRGTKRVVTRGIPKK